MSLHSQPYAFSIYKESAMPQMGGSVLSFQSSCGKSFCDMQGLGFDHGAGPKTFRISSQISSSCFVQIWHAEGGKPKLALQPVVIR